jgi:SAM-dependent methyltransferase
MRLDLLDLLACPGCGRGDLDLEGVRLDRSRRPAELGAGVLSCAGCRRTYPVVAGIPRLLPDSWHEHRERLAPGLARRARGDRAELRRFRALHGSTRESFGFEWERHPPPRPDECREFFRRSTGLSADLLRGRRVLDAGCGMGRYLEIAAELGADVVGLDLSRAVERAARETRTPERVQLVQGDLLAPPFAPGSFDVVFSIGALHHTVDTHDAFRALLPLVRPGGRIAVWVYKVAEPEAPVAGYKRRFERLADALSDGLRRGTTRLSHRTLHRLAYAAVPLGWLKRFADRTSARRHLLWPLLLPPVSAHPDWRVRVSDTFDWLSPRYQWKHTTREVRDWFAAAGLTEIRTLDLPVAVTGVKPAG